QESETRGYVHVVDADRRRRIEVERAVAGLWVGADQRVAHRRRQAPCLFRNLLIRLAAIPREPLRIIEDAALPGDLRSQLPRQPGIGGAQIDPESLAALG